MGYAMRMVAAVLMVMAFAAGCGGALRTTDPCAGQTRGSCGVQESGPSPSSE